MTNRRRTASRTSEGAATTPKRTRRAEPGVAESRVKRDRLLGGDQDGRRIIVSDEEFRDNNRALTLKTFDDALKVTSLDFLISENRSAHHTNEYEQENLIVRRGQGFSVVTTFDRDVEPSEDIIVLQFAFGARPQESKGTLLRLPLNLSKENIGVALGWVARATDVSGSKVTVEVSSESDAMVGVYHMYVETKLHSKPRTDFTRYETDEKIYVLFNPWCQDDDVYMEDEKERFEYVLNDTGRIWTGSARCNSGRPWNFGQFEEPVLDVTLGLLAKGELAPSGRDCVSSVIRCLSAMANSEDDDGVLEGRWTSEYPKGCTKPWEWTGSVGIIEQYHRTGKPVQYGQCWVFSGLITTLLRSLGIPTRSVTNFESAHDIDCSMTIDTHFNKEGEPLENLNDSVWNFHVWNESYFRRNDLPPGYDGWQAHDATPQELSEGVMRCGPAPLAAIKQGHVYLSFDVGFIFAEVNGDKVEWEVQDDGSMKVLHIDRYSVGRNISTKAVGYPLRHDLTLDYKYADGSPEEQEVLKRVNRFSTKRKQNLYKQDVESQVTFNLKLPTDKVIGEDIEPMVEIHNVSDHDRTVKVTMTLASTFYTGVVGQKVKSEVFEVKIGGDKAEIVKMAVIADEYQAVMNPEANFKLTVTCRVIETNDMFATSESFFLRKPPLIFDVPARLCSYTVTKGKLTFKNTTNIKLHSGVFHMEGSYVLTSKAYHIRKIIHPGDEVSVDLDLFPRRLGHREVMATFSSAEITGIEGAKEVFVVSKSRWAEEENEDMTEDEIKAKDAKSGDKKKEKNEEKNGSDEKGEDEKNGNEETDDEKMDVGENEPDV